MSLLAGVRVFRIPFHPASTRRAFSLSAIRLEGSEVQDKKKRQWKENLSNTGTKLATRSKAGSRGAANDPLARLRVDINKHYSGRHALFRSAILHRFSKVLTSILREDSDPVSSDELWRHTNTFMDQVDHALHLAEHGVTRRDKNPLFWNLRDAFINRNLSGLGKEIQFSFQGLIMQTRFSKGIKDSQKHLLDFRYPLEWFPATRAVQRTIHVHVGPTNSGKTYTALKALKESKNGVYAGPLRLLANEVYQRFVAQGLPCALLTGEEVRIPEDTDQYLISCTVEMVPLNQRFDVAVIDEIQMIADSRRGPAWTNALLGVQADNVHVCGEERTVELIEKICAFIGDKCVIHRYERLTPLQTMEHPVKLGDLEKGDAVVAFSRQDLHVLKRKVEKSTGKRCAIIYGSLPPEVRVQQAALFNDPDNDYDYVVASDAIGMGLNLEIRRVIFESVFKFDGAQNRILTHPEMKQIGGRAGRYRSSRAETHKAGEATSEQVQVQEEEQQKTGYVSCVDSQDLAPVQKSFQVQMNPIEHAIIEPPAGIVERFSSYFPPKTALSYILTRLAGMATLGDTFRLQLDPLKLETADLIEDIDLTIYDRLTLLNLPVSMRLERGREVLRALSRVISTQRGGSLLAVKEIPLEFLDEDLEEYKMRDKMQDYLHKLESLHGAINQYLWLSYRYSYLFRDQAMAFHVRSLVEVRLMQVLDDLDFTESQLAMRRKLRRDQAERRKLRESQVGEGNEGMGEAQEQVEDDPPVDDLAERYQTKAGERQEAPPLAKQQEAPPLAEQHETPPVAERPASTPTGS